MKKLLITILILSFTLPSYAFFWNKKDKALELELEGKGYAGSLPQLNKNHNDNKNKTKVSTPIFDSLDNFNDPSDLKPVPQDNPAFINIIQKKDNTSAFYNDANEIIPMLEKLVDCIEDKENLQLFITKANVLTMNIDYLSKKYEGKPESFYESFRKLQDVNRSVKTISTLRKEALTYQKYLAYSTTGSIYNPENIEQQLEYLIEELNSSILLLREQY